MASSTVPAVKAYLLSLFRQQADLVGVNIEWAAPVKDEDYTDDIIWLDATVDHQDDFINLGGGRLDEEYEIGIVCQAWLEGNDPQSTEERGWELREAVVTALRADPTLGGTVNRWSGPYPTHMQLRPASPNGWLAKGTIRLMCRARV